MSEAKESRWPIWTIVALLVAFIGIVVPIIWDLYKGRSTLELQLLSSASLVSKREDVKNLRILYGDKEISELTKATFILINSGKRPILSKDIVKRPSFRLTGSVKILETVIEKQEPKNVDVLLKPVEGEESIEFDFQLLNPGDFLEFSILVNGPLSGVEVDARIADIKELKYVDRRTELSGNQQKLSWSVYVAGCFTVFFTLGAVVCYRDYRRAKLAVSRFRFRKLDMEKWTKKKDFIESMEKEIQYFFPEQGRYSRSTNTKGLIRFIEEDNGDALELSEAAKKALIKDIETTIAEGVSKEKEPLKGLFLICTFGWAYVIYSLWTYFSLTDQVFSYLR